MSQMDRREALKTFSEFEASVRMAFKRISGASWKASGSQFGAALEATFKTWWPVFCRLLGFPGWAWKSSKPWLLFEEVGLL